MARRRGVCIAAVVVVVVIAAGIGVSFFFPAIYAKRFAKERGPIELLAVGGYFIALPYALMLWKSGRLPVGRSLAFILLLFALRELDFHADYTTDNFFKTNYYFSGRVPVMEKLLIIALMTGISVFMVWFLRRYARGFLDALKRRVLWAVMLVMGLGAAGASKLADNIVVWLDRMHVVFEGAIRDRMPLIEESIEVAIPAFFLLALFAAGGTYVTTNASASTESGADDTTRGVSGSATDGATSDAADGT